jgi:hypothetical protein
MAIVNVHKTVAKHVFGRITHCPTNRRAKQHSSRFVSVVLSVGVMLVLTFLLLTFAMVFLQTLDQWHK